MICVFNGLDLLGLLGEDGKFGASRTKITGGGTLPTEGTDHVRHRPKNEILWDSDSNTKCFFYTVLFEGIECNLEDVRLHIPPVVCPLRDPALQNWTRFYKAVL